MKPTHHLDDATLLSYSASALPTAMAVVVAAHLDRCQLCRDHLLEADQIGGALMQQQRPATSSASAREAMLARLALEPELASRPLQPPPAAFDPDQLPAPLHPWFGNSLRALRWQRVAPACSVSGPAASRAPISCCCALHPAAGCRCIATAAAS